MYTFQIPAAGLNGEVLAAELGVPWDALSVVDGTLVVAADGDEAAMAAVIAAHDPAAAPPRPLDKHGVAATLNAVLGVWSLFDAANAVDLSEQALIDEATAWLVVAGNE